MNFLHCPWAPVNTAWNQAKWAPEYLYSNEQEEKIEHIDYSGSAEIDGYQFLDTQYIENNADEHQSQNQPAWRKY